MVSIKFTFSFTQRPVAYCQYEFIRGAIPFLTSSLGSEFSLAYRLRKLLARLFLSPSWNPDFAPSNPLTTDNENSLLYCLAAGSLALSFFFERAPDASATARATPAPVVAEASLLPALTMGEPATELPAAGDQARWPQHRQAHGR